MPNGIGVQAVLNIILKMTDQTSKAMKSAEGGLAGFGKMTTRVGKGLTKTLTPAILAVGAATIKMATDAAVVQQMREGFELMAESVGVNAAEALERMSGATKGLIADADLMRIANKALAGSSEAVRAAFFENLPTLEAFALRMSQIQGIPLDVTLDKLITGLKRMSPKLIDDTGLMFKMGDVTERASEMFGKAAEELSAEEQQLALLEIVGAKAAEQIKIVGDVHIGLNEQLKASRVQFENVKDTLGEALIPVVMILSDALGGLMTELTPLIKRLAEFTTNFVKAHPEATKIVLVIAAFAAALGPLLIIVGQVAMAISALTPILGVVGGALALLTGPIGLVIAAIGLLAVAWAKDWGGIREKTQKAIDKIRTFITNLRLAIEAFLYNLPNRIEDFKQMGKNLISGLIQGVVSMAQKLVDTVVDVITAPIKIIHKILEMSDSKVFAEIGTSMLTGLVRGLVDSASLPAKTITSLFEGIREIIQRAGFGIAEDLSIVPQSFWDTTKAVQKSGQALADQVSGIIGQVSSFVQTKGFRLAEDLSVVGAGFYGPEYYERIAAQQAPPTAAQQPVVAKQAAAVQQAAARFYIAEDLSIVPASFYRPEQLAGKMGFPTRAAAQRAVQQMQGFQFGGVVPGRGPRLAVVHGGETITPAGGGRDIVVPVYLDGREIARVISPYLGEEYRRERGLRV